MIYDGGGLLLTGIMIVVFALWVREQYRKGQLLDLIRSQMNEGAFLQLIKGTKLAAGRPVFSDEIQKRIGIIRQHVEETIRIIKEEGEKPILKPATRTVILEKIILLRRFVVESMNSIL
jgi:hypothetical protein